MEYHSILTILVTVMVFVPTLAFLVITWGKWGHFAIVVCLTAVAYWVYFHHMGDALKRLHVEEPLVAVLVAAGMAAALIYYHRMTLLRLGKTLFSRVRALR